MKKRKDNAPLKASIGELIKQKQREQAKDVEDVDLEDLTDEERFGKRPKRKTK